MVLIIRAKTVASGGVEGIFRDTTLDALNAAEAPCKFLFTRNLRPRNTPLLRPVAPPQTETSSPAISAPLRPPYVTSASTRTRGALRIPRPGPKKLLFLRQNDLGPLRVLKLVCSDCSRSDFSSLQGLLNHCRLRHKREYGSHDDCVQNCAVPVEGEEQQAWVIANGTEVVGLPVPGLRRLFEMAVGSGKLEPNNQVLQIPSQEDKRDVVKGGSETPDVDPRQSTTPSTEVTKTLGIHEDSPALAQLLGRNAKPRRINAYNEDEIVDISSSEKTLPEQPRIGVWKMSFAQRSQTASHADENNTPITNPPDETFKLPAPKISTPIPSISEVGVRSRFHITTRICIEDRSMFILPGMF